MQLVKLSVGAVLAALASASAPAGAPPLATEIVAQGLSAPTYATFAPGDPSRVYVIEQGGVIKVVKDGVLQATPFLDISAIVPNETFNGLIGIAFHPGFETNGFFYLHHPLGASQFSSNRLALVRYTATSADVADPASRDEIMVLDYPSLPGHHVGGWIGFDDAGYLRIGLGDGGTTGQENPGGARSQSLDSPWG
jgi:glucose/arabinose dehydrogenase